MGDRPLWDIFLENEVENLQTVLTRIGIDGLLNEFENWLNRNQIINEYNALLIRDRL